AEELVRGASIGRYVVVERIGRGGMGVVYAAYDPQLDRKGAGKVLRHAGGAPFRGAEDQLLQEGRAIARLASPSVVAVHDVGVHHGRIFVAMELVGGQALASWLRA